MGLGLAFIQIILLDIAFLALCVLAVSPLIAYKKAAFAVLKRNFVGYFSNPTGYVFLCLFVLLTSFAAFWPHEFFTANLANLDQLNQVLPLIMLVFIPAITMSIWSEERRQGTDELLLTLPADDFDIVIGKYLAAAAIFTASLMFSQFSNYMVLASLSMGDVDTGLFFATYLGYWLVGLAMLSVGMVASFLTSNMTIGFILGAALNAPLAFSANSDVIIPSSNWARNVSFWSLAERFDDFGRGVFSLSSVVYFGLVIVVGLYVSMVQIGARHWSGKGGPWQFMHYVIRTLALAAILAFATMFFTSHDWLRFDATAGKVSSLSPKTKQLIRELDSKSPVVIDAFIGADVPEDYVQTKFNLISLLREFEALSRGKIKVNLHDSLEPFSEDAALAEERFGIAPTLVQAQVRGAWTQEEVIMGAAFSCGLDKVVVPFFDYGIPVEYELIRSIGTVSQSGRKKLGVVRTDAQLFGGFSFAGGMPQQIPRSPFLTELEKQYDIEEVDPSSPIDGEKYDALLIVQPSSLGPQELPNVVDAVKSGVPSAIFEDPRPSLAEMSRAPGTSEPKQAPGGMFGGGGGGPQPKGRIEELWEAIGIRVEGQPAAMGFEPDLAWQTYNPYPKLAKQPGFNDAWVFAGNEAPGGEESLNAEDPITAGLEEILLPMAGTINPSRNSSFKFTPLIQTGGLAGRVRFETFQRARSEGVELSRLQGTSTGRQVIAARIRDVSSSDQGDVADNEDAKAAEDSGNSDVEDEGEESSNESTERDANRGINVVYVADIDLMMSQFVRLRAQPSNEIRFRFENVTFLLNVIDVLTGDDSYVEIRRRKPYHSTLRVVEEQVREQRGSEEAVIDKFQTKYDEETKALEEQDKAELKEYDDRRAKLREQLLAGKDVRPEISALDQSRGIKERELEIKKLVKREQLETELNEKVKEARRETEVKIVKIQNFYKFLAVALPPIPPLLVGLVVFVSRRLREREGIAKSRLRS